MIYIDTQTGIDEAAAVLSRSSWAAVDTEADSLHHYQEKLCLLQVSVEGEDFVIDPLAKVDLSEFARILSEKFLIFQGADFDIRMVRRVADFRPREIFDTMIAAQVLGYDKQGLADLALRHCGVTLPKAGQKADWSRRPLTPALLEYAANDTHYLRPVQQAMQRELAELGRAEWHRQNVGRMLKSVMEPRPAPPADADDRWQVKGSKDLKGKSVTVLRELWRWREEEARRRDRPSFKVLNTEYLIGAARWTGQHPGKDIAEWAEAPRNVRGEHREAMNRAIRSADSMPQAEFTKPPRDKFRKRWTEADNKKLELLKAERQKLAEVYKVTPSLLATNTNLETLILAAPKDRAALESTDCLLPWQLEIVAEPFLNILGKEAGKAKSG